MAFKLFFKHLLEAKLLVLQLMSFLFVITQGFPSFFYQMQNKETEGMNV